MTLKEDFFCKFYDPTAFDECLSFDYWHSIKQLHLEREAFYHARKAISDKNNPLALLRLGRIYDFGIGTLINYTLAHYFYKQALARGCQEALEYITDEYADDRRSILEDFEAEKGGGAHASADTVAWYRQIIEHERQRGFVGLISAIRPHIKLFYPDYDKTRGINDIISGRNTLNADIFYALSTANCLAEKNLDKREEFMRQLCKPITDDAELVRCAADVDSYEWAREDERELYQAMINFRDSYQEYCDKSGIKPRDFTLPDELSFLSCIPAQTLRLIRRQLVCCLLSLRDAHPLIRKEFLTHLSSDEFLLTLVEKIPDQDLQLALISFVEINIDIESLEFKYRNLYNAYHRGDVAPLCTFLNDLAQSFSEAGIPHHLPHYTLDNPPQLKPKQ